MILGMAASTDSAINRVRFQGMDYASAPSFRLLEAAWLAAKERKMPVHVGKIVSSDSFYTEDPDQWRLWARFGVIGVEMEAAELYTLAAKYGVEALAVLTVSDHLVTHEATSAAEREKTFLSMVEVGLAAALAR
jgi:purine-nucleoside phosphorylase